MKKIICPFVIAAMTLPACAHTLAADGNNGGLLLHYSFSDMNTDEIVKDMSGNGNDGIIYGDADIEPGRIHFDGEDDYIKMPDGLLKDCGEVTVAINVCPEFDSLHYFTWNFGTSSSEGYMFLNTSRPEQRLRFAITPTGADKEKELRFDDDIKRGTWSNVIVTFKGNEGIMYRDGVMAAKNSFTVTPKDLGNTVQNWIGRSPYGDALMQGYVEDFRVYNRALSETEVKALSDEYMTNLANPVTNAVIDGGLKSTVKSDITLPTSAGGAEIKWTSSNESVITSDGRVTRPKHGDYSAEVTLTAQITEGDKTETKSYTVSVPAEGGGTYGINITGEKGAEINRDMIGLFFEDINYAADGGLYAEMIENRSFEAMYNDNKTFNPVYDGGWAWREYPDGKGELVLKSDEPLNANNTHYLEFNAARGSFANAAYDGLAMRKGMVYHGSFYAKTKDYAGAVKISAIKDGREIVAAEVDKLSADWTKHEFDMTATEDVRGADFVITLDGAGTVDFDMVSLMPDDTVCGVFRSDLVKMLKDINPGFLRFPGGCIIEGYDLNNRYNWKDSIGDVAQRKENWNRWDLHTDGYNHYNQTLGLGFYEFFELCEYLGCEAVPVVNMGMACQFQTSELVPVGSDEFNQYVRDALDLIEFANGDVNTTYGAIRAAMGHPEPFNLTMMGLGNEQWSTPENQLRARFEAFEAAIHEKYPDMKLIGTSGPDVNSGGWRWAWNWIREDEAKNDNFVYAVDEHYYMTPSWFLQNTDFYDSYDRGTNVFAGEYASRTRNLPNDPEANTLYTALTEAAYFTGLERNSDVVKMSCYAPLFARVGYTQWSPDLIWFDDVSCYGSPSYYVQKMNSNNMGDYNVGYEIKEGSSDNGMFSNVSYDGENEELIIKLVNTTGDARKALINVNGYERTGVGASFTSLYVSEGTERQKELSNSIENPELIKDANGMITDLIYQISIDAEPYSFNIIRAKARPAETMDELSNLTDAELSNLTRGGFMLKAALSTKDFDTGVMYRSEFTDITSLYFIRPDYYNAIGYLQKNGIVEGYDDGTVRPEQIITRDEVNIILSRMKNK